MVYFITFQPQVELNVLLKELHCELHLTHASLTGKSEIRKITEEEGVKTEKGSKYT